MRFFSIAFLCVIALSGCKTADGFAERMNGWINEDLDHLIEAWGPPHSVYEQKNSGKVVEYNRVSTRYIPGITTTTPQTTYFSGTVTSPTSGSIYTGQGTATTYTTQTSSGYNLNLRCRTVINVNSADQITSWRAEGNNCVAEPLTAEEKQRASEKNRAVYKEIERSRNNYYKNKKRKCLKGDEIRQLTGIECIQWGGKRNY